MDNSGRDETPDEALVDEYRRDPDGARGHAAVSQLLARYEGRVFGWCHRYARDRERALDLTQEVLTRAWKGLGTFRGGSRFSWWMFVITRNRCLSAMRTPALLVDDDLVLEDLPAKGPLPDDAYEQQFDEDTILNLIQTHLDAEERMALWLCCFERMPVDEITRTMQLTGATGARGLLQRARRRLRAALDGRGRNDA